MTEKWQIQTSKSLVKMMCAFSDIVTKFFAIQTLCLSGCVARIADFGSSEPGTKPGERSISPQYANTTYTLWIICFKPGSLRGSISRPFDLKSNALPLRHGGKKIFGKKIWVFTPHIFLIWGGYHNPVIS